MINQSSFDGRKGKKNVEGELTGGGNESRYSA